MWISRFLALAGVQFRSGCDGACAGSNTYQQIEEVKAFGFCAQRRYTGMLASPSIRSAIGTTKGGDLSQTRQNLDYDLLRAAAVSEHLPLDVKVMVHLKEMLRNGNCKRHL